MDVVLRTSYGEAELTIRHAGADCTLVDVIEYVTSRTCPPITFVDGRALPSTTELRNAGLAVGSMISTTNDTRPQAETVVELVQVAGRGAGTRVSMTAGRFAIGEGRSTHARELSSAPVDEAALEMTISDSGSVLVRKRLAAVHINGQAVVVAKDVPWTWGTLDVLGRVFELDRRGLHPARSTNRLVSTIDSAGKIPFNRIHHRDAADNSPALHVAEAARMAVLADQRLWERQPGDGNIFQIPVGLAYPVGVDPVPSMSTVSIDLQTEVGIAIHGRSDFVSGLTRGLLIGTCTAHSPADLELVVLTDGDRIHEWEWAKWLPHTRAAGKPTVLFTAEQVGKWAESMSAPSGSAPDNSTLTHITLVVIDSIHWWKLRGSPLRQLLDDPPPTMRFIILTNGRETLPAVCTTRVSEDDASSDLASIDSNGRNLDGLRPFIAGTEVALEVARSLAPLDDQDQAASDYRTNRQSVDLIDLIQSIGADVRQIDIHWARDRVGSTPRAPLASGPSGLFELDLVEHGPLVFIGGSGSADVVRTIVAALAIDAAPSRLQFIVFETGSSESVSELSEFPHVSGVISDPDDRLVRRILNHVRSDNSRLSSLVVIIHDFEGFAAAHPTELLELAGIARELPNFGLSLILTTQDSAVPPEGVAASADTRITKQSDEGKKGGGKWRVETTTDEATAELEMVQAPPWIEPDPEHRNAPSHSLDIRPFVIGREPSPMERRLSRKHPDDETSNGREGSSGYVHTSMNEVVRWMTRASQTATLASPLGELAVALPESIPLRAFFGDHAGDGVPFGLIDTLHTQHRPAAWWTPDRNGSTIVFGDRGAGKTSLLATFGVGIGLRYSADDVHLYCIGGADHRLDPLARLPHAGLCTAVNDPGAVSRLLLRLGDELDRRRDQIADVSQPVATWATIVLIIDDIAALLEVLASDASQQPERRRAKSAMGRLIVEGEQVGICVVIAAQEAREIPERWFQRFPQRIVLQLPTADDYADVGVSKSAIPEPFAGRAIHLTETVADAPNEYETSEIQVVVCPDNLDQFIDEMQLESAAERHPLRIDG